MAGHHLPCVFGLSLLNDLVLRWSCDVIHLAKLPFIEGLAQPRVSSSSQMRFCGSGQASLKDVV
jgi:hypothetical protein